jgi:hypothetical protein
MLRWDDGTEELHPSKAYPATAKLIGLTIGGSSTRVADWLGTPIDALLDDVKVAWTAPNGTPGIMSVRFETDKGVVEL